jgi:opacity protein-like surface antigen
MLTRLLVAAGVAIASGAAQAAYVPNSVSGATFQISSTDGGLGGGEAFLNSEGGDPFNSGPWIEFPDDFNFFANLGPAGTFSNSPLSTINPFGDPDTTSYGEWFVAPANATLSEFDFSIQNASSGTNATFVLATWDQSTETPVTLLYAQSSYVNNDGNFDPNVNIVPNIPLIAGQDYIAFLTVSSAVTPTVPETSTWVMMALGFAGFGIARCRLRRKASPVLA